MSNPPVRLLPHRLESEMCVIGAALLSGSMTETLLALVRPADFYSHANRLWWEAITELARKRQPGDIFTVKAELVRRGEYGSAGGDEQRALLEQSAMLATAEHHAREVAKAATLRRVADTCHGIIERVYAGWDEPEELCAEAVRLVEGAAQQAGAPDWVDAAQWASELVEWISADEAAAPGIPYGFPYLDRKTGGARPTELTILTGYPGMGKTAMMLEFIEACHLHKQRSGLFSIEMDRRWMAIRMAARMARVDANLIRDRKLYGAEFDRVASAAGRMADLRFGIIDRSDIDAQAMRMRLREFTRKQPVGVVLVDYLQRMRGRGRAENRNLEVGQMAKDLKNLAREFNTHVIVASSLSRPQKGREQEMPTQSALRESGDIEFEADNILILHRPRKDENAVLRVAKCRNGEDGFDVFLTYHGSHLRFEQNSEQQPADDQDPGYRYDDEDDQPARSMRDRVREEREIYGGELALNGAAHLNGQGRGGY